MSPQTKANVNLLESATWLSKVGVADCEYAIVLKSWESVSASLSDGEWEQMGLDAGNTLSENVLAVSKPRLNEWNERVKGLTPVVKKLVNRKIMKQGKLPSTFESFVEWDILHLLLESEYCDIVKPGWFSSLGYYYVRGHFPCGWEGDYPKGTLVVY